MGRKLSYKTLIETNERLMAQKVELECLVADLIKTNKSVIAKRNQPGKQLSKVKLQCEKLISDNSVKDKKAKEQALVISGIQNKFRLQHSKVNELTKQNNQLLSFTEMTTQEIGEPLRKIQVFTYRIRKTENARLESESQRLLERVRSSTSRMQQLVSALQVYTRSSSGEQKFIHTDLKTILNDVKKELQPEIHSRKASIRIKDIGFAVVDPIQFKHVFYNLISNALKFSRPGLSPKILIARSRLRAKKNEDLPNAGNREFIKISVQDNGIGFSAEHSEKIFEPFQRLHGNDEYPGTGVGLTIVKKIVENHRGVIIANSEEDKGSDFQIIIPLRPELKIVGEKLLTD